MNVEDVYKACLQVLSENRFENIALADVAAVLGVKKPSLYRYCDSKESLIRDSLQYADKQLKVVNFNMDFSLSCREILRKLVCHYINLFQIPENRNFLSCIMCLHEHHFDGVCTLDDLIYIFETQIFFIVSELSERKGLCLKTGAESFSHMMALMVLERIVSSQDNLEWELDRMMDLIGECVCV